MLSSRSEETAFDWSVWSFVHWYEEPSLRRRFGADYEEYLRTGPGWWPRLLRNRATGTS
jgi:protein-S-isoprenylcysteine O-methyltransferase Ste14